MSNGRPTQSIEADGSHQYTAFDDIRRLTGSQHGDQAHRYRFDGAGNMIERQQPDGERLTMGYDGANPW